MEQETAGKDDSVTAELALHEAERGLVLVNRKGAGVSTRVMELCRKGPRDGDCQAPSRSDMENMEKQPSRTDYDQNGRGAKVVRSKRVVPDLATAFREDPQWCS